MLILATIIALNFVGARILKYISHYVYWCHLTTHTRQNAQIAHSHSGTNMRYSNKTDQNSSTNSEAHPTMFPDVLTRPCCEPKLIMAGTRNTQDRRLEWWHFHISSWSPWTNAFQSYSHFSSKSCPYARSLVWVIEHLIVLNTYYWQISFVNLGPSFIWNRAFSMTFASHNPQNRYLYVVEVGLHGVSAAAWGRFYDFWEWCVSIERWVWPHVFVAWNDWFLGYRQLLHGVG